MDEEGKKMEATVFDFVEHRTKKKISSYTEVKPIKRLNSTQMKLSNDFKKRNEERD